MGEIRERNREKGKKDERRKRKGERGREEREREREGPRLRRPKFPLLGGTNSVGAHTLSSLIEGGYVKERVFSLPFSLIEDLCSVSFNRRQGKHMWKSLEAGRDGASLMRNRKVNCGAKKSSQRERDIKGKEKQGKGKRERGERRKRGGEKRGESEGERERKAHFQVGGGQAPD